jgi:hypothetical protein
MDTDEKREVSVNLPSKLIERLLEICEARNQSLDIVIAEYLQTQINHIVVVL